MRGARDHTRHACGGGSLWRASLVLVAAAIAGCAPDAPSPATTQPVGATTQPKPMRIASVVLAADETLLELVGPDRLVAVSAYADDASYSNVAGKVPKHVLRIRGDIEAILGVRPDLVCVSDISMPGFLKLLERSGLRTYMNNRYHTIAGIRAGILELGDVVGEPERARRMVGRMDARLAAVRRKLEGITTRPRVLHWSGGWTSGTYTTLDDVIIAAGGRNAAAELGLRGPAEISVAHVLKLDPDCVLVSARAQDMSLAAIGQHPALKGIRAVRANRIIRVPAPALLAISHYVVDGVEICARQLHPARFGTPAARPVASQPRVGGRDR